MGTVLKGVLIVRSGGLCLLGDQNIFVRAADFAAVGGFAEELPIMCAPAAAT